MFRKWIEMTGDIWPAYPQTTAYMSGPKLTHEEAVIEHNALVDNYMKLTKSIHDTNHREIDRLRAALVQCAEWFDEYARIHQEKGNADKADRNAVRADFIRSFMQVQS